MSSRYNKPHVPCFGYRVEISWTFLLKFSEYRELNVYVAHVDRQTIVNLTFCCNFRE